MAIQDLTPQLRTRLRKVEWMVLSFVTGALLVAALAVSWWIKKTGDVRGWFVLQTPYYTYLETASGVRVGTPVKMLGFTVGQVTEIEAENDNAWTRAHRYNVFVKLMVRHPYEGYLQTDSTIRLGGGGIDLLGGAWLELTRAEGSGIPTVQWTNNTPLLLSDKYAHADPDSPDRAKFLLYRPYRASGNGYFLRTERFISLMDNAEAAAEILRYALPNITNQIARTLSEVNQIAAQVAAASARPGGLGEMAMPTNINQRLDQTLADLAALSKRLEPMADETRRMLVSVEDNSRRVGPLLDNVRSAVTNIQNTVEVIGSQASNTNLVANLSRVADKAALLADTTSTLVRRHWLFRSAFRTNEPASAGSPAAHHPPDRSRF